MESQAFRLQSKKRFFSVSTLLGTQLLLILASAYCVLFFTHSMRHHDTKSHPELQNVPCEALGLLKFEMFGAMQ